MSTPLGQIIDGITAANEKKGPNHDYGVTTQGGQGSDSYTTGNGLLSVLSLPDNIHPDSTFTWQAHLQVTKDANGNPLGGPAMGPYQPGNDPNQSQLTQMTMAGAMSWLRELALNQGEPGGDYDAIVHQLVAAGYLAPAQARYNGFTNDVANAFLRSAADVWNVNSHGGDTGQLYTWGDHIDALIKGRQASGQIDANGNPAGSGGGTPTPTRTDTYTNPEDAKAAINSAAKNILGRELSDHEVSTFQALYHGMEATYNSQAWAQQQATAANAPKAPDVTQAPSLSGESKNYMEDAPAFGQERTTQLLGSYIGVLRNMTGLGAGGVSNAVA